ncbi:hypothetical protein [Geminicoccus flavidas]|uniref:hypothetical protein n=1 Tax=Geminicoccus flavidas TaxID=2506407 RepID=UPI001356BB36|nr:hypothetical protein [Geminicoccus flavidas]
MSVSCSARSRQPLPLNRAIAQARLATVENHLAASELRITRIWHWLARQQATGRDTHGSGAILATMEQVLAQWRRQRQALLDQLWPTDGAG